MAQSLPATRVPVALAESPDGAYPWSRLAGEPEDSWGGFRVYRDAAYPSGLDGPWCARVVPPRVGRLAREWQWDGRALAFDRYLDTALTHALLDEATALRRSQMRRISKLSGLLESEIGHHIGRSEYLNQFAEVPVTTLAVREIISGLEMVFKHEQTLLGKPSDIIRTESLQASWDLTGASIEDLEAIEELRGRLAPPKVGG